MTQTQWNNLDKRELSPKAMDLVAISDQHIFEYVKDIDITNISRINEVLEAISDEIGED